MESIHTLWLVSFIPNLESQPLNAHPLFFSFIEATVLYKMDSQRPTRKESGTKEKSRKIKTSKVKANPRDGFMHFDVSLEMKQLRF